jgi:hypothetical protein
MLCHPPIHVRAHLLPDQSLAGNLISRSKNLLSRSSCLSILKDFHPSLWPQEGGHIINHSVDRSVKKSPLPFRKWFTLTTSLPPSLPPSLSPSSCQTFLAALASILALKRQIVWSSLRGKLLNVREVKHDHEKERGEIMKKIQSIGFTRYVLFKIELYFT